MRLERSYSVLIVNHYPFAVRVQPTLYWSAAVTVTFLTINKAVKVLLQKFVGSSDYR